MAFIPKTNVVNGNTIQASDITNIIDSLNGTGLYDISATGSLLGSASFATTASYALNVSPPSGPDAAVQFKSGSVFSGSANFKFDYTLNSLAHGLSNTATGQYSHAEGQNTQASGSYSHAEGRGTIAFGNWSHAEGRDTIASGSYQTVVGQQNEHGDTTSLFIVGGGIQDTRKDAFKVTHSSSIQIPQTQSVAPSWTGRDGEIVPVTTPGVTGGYYLYMWMNGAWRSSSFT